MIVVVVEMSFLGGGIGASCVSRELEAELAGIMGDGVESLVDDAEDG